MDGDTRVKRLIALALVVMAMACAGSSGAAEKTVVWDKSTLVRVQSGGSYARMVRVAGGDILCGFESWGKACVSRSTDDGKTWSKAEQVAKAPSGSASNAEMLVLANGWILYLYNERPNDGVHHFTIQVMVSKDNGHKWTHMSNVYEAGTEFHNGCWEPAAIQLPSGEIQLFFANEYPYIHSKEQEISMCRSFNNGRKWTEAKPISFRAEHRDGMPVPLILRGGKGIVVAIEDNGYTLMFTPTIVYTRMEDNWKTCATAASPNRWSAIKKPTSVEWGGAPFIRQMPSGETVLSFQSSVGCQQPQMVVYVGDETARNFTGRSVPFVVPSDKGGWWNSLFVKNASTITAITSSEGSIWAIDGHIEPIKPAP